MLLLTSFSAFSATNRGQNPGLSEAYAGRKDKEIPFYKSKNSPFPSGFSSFDRLNDKVISTEIGEAFYLEKDHQKISPSLVPYITAFHLSRTWIEKYTKRRIPASPDKNISTILLNYETDPADRGLVLTINETKLKKDPSTKAVSIAVIPNLNYFIPISFEKGFIKVLYKKNFGYIDINDCITKFDFARFAFSVKATTNTWEIIRRREFDSLITANENSLPLNQIKGLIVDEKLSFIFKNNEHYPKWTSLKIVKEKTAPWLQSQMQGHGLVWWHKNMSDSQSNSTISIDELLKKEIYSVSFQADNPKKGVASAHGVFITIDGQNWTAIEQFKDYSGPVHYYNDSLLFVGNYRSTDGGKTFENYIQVDKVSAAIWQYLGSQPKRIQITKIKVQKPFNILIDVDTGPKKIRLKSMLYAQDWKYYKSL